jgi:hypothetical protein
LFFPFNPVSIQRKEGGGCGGERSDEKDKGRITIAKMRNQFCECLAWIVLSPTPPPIHPSI